MSPTCSIPGCTKPAIGRGWCRTHYSRWQRHGIDPAEAPRRLEVLDRFWLYVDQSGPLKRRKLGRCWSWGGPHNTKPGFEYGRFYIKGRGNLLAHRFVYELMVGPIPDGAEIDHLCRNPRCVNPAHLEAVIHRINIQRGTSPSVAHAAKTHCPNGHPYDIITEHKRRCRVCRNENARRSYHRRRAS